MSEYRFNKPREAARALKENAVNLVRNPRDQLKRGARGLRDVLRGAGMVDRAAQHLERRPGEIDEYLDTLELKRPVEKYAKGGSVRGYGKARGGKKCRVM